MGWLACEAELGNEGRAVSCALTFSVHRAGLGLGKLGDRDGEGILAGALPSVKTVLNGFTQITPQLMALGYTAG